MPNAKLNYETKLIREFEIDALLNQQIIDLRLSCFKESETDRSYFKQLPHHRLLAYQNDQPIAHVGVDHRVITISRKPYKIFGLIDVCVSPQHQGKGIASSLLDYLTLLGKEHTLDFLVAFASDSRIYDKNGFHLVDNYFQWLRIHEHQNYGVSIERIDKEVWVKSLSKLSSEGLRDRPWAEGPVDLLGYLF